MYWFTNDKRIMNNDEHRAEQIIEYCFRPSSKVNDTIVKGPISSTLTFDELKKAHVTAENLIAWSSPIDLAERYQSYLQMVNSSSMEKFINCTVPWFGPLCQYNFGLNSSFSDIVSRTFDSKNFRSDMMNLTCYVHLKCNRGPSPICLDWREICDGKVDCLDGGEDEKHCLELWTNQCAENEYQCRNGMCVDKVFLLDDYINHSDWDNPLNLECLDQTDEKVWDDGTCYMNPRFICEDTVCRSPLYFSCGDGRCTSWPLPEKRTPCFNTRGATFSISINWSSPVTKPLAHCLSVIACASEYDDEYCETVCETAEECKIQIHQYCQSSFFFPTFPVWDSHVRLGFFSNVTQLESTSIIPHFICYNHHQCPFLTPTLHVDNYTCRHIHEFNLTSLDAPYNAFLHCTRRYHNGNETHCPKPSMWRCPGTNTCIPKHQIMDGISHCYGSFDESVSTYSCELNETYRFNCTSEKKCLSPLLINDDMQQCLGGEDEFKIHGYVTDIQNLFFSALCDDRINMVSSANETDETHCERWPCVNEYTRCNKVWDCPKGIDELNCSSRFNCPSNHHPCLHPKNNTVGCLHVNRIEDGIVDCIGAIDERSYCRLKYPSNTVRRYRCWNHTACVENIFGCLKCSQLDQIDNGCRYVSDEQDYKEYVDLLNDKLINKVSFSPNFSRSFPITRPVQPVDKHKYEQITPIERFQNDDEIANHRAWLCNRGIMILVGEEQTEECLCPPSYYGNRCQYQNQRISLTLRFRTANVVKLDIIGIVITLVDHTDFVHSHNQVTYIPTRDCNTKFNIYLLYQNRSKDMTKNYTIHVDAYDKSNLKYITSWTLPIKLPFMPINRVSVELIIPAKRTETLLHHCSLSYDRRYRMRLRNTDVELCRCDSDWLRENSTVCYKCNCSSDSICVGFVNNRSICLCPLTKTGPRCLLDSVCQLSMCMNGGRCVPKEERDSFANFICVCQDGFSGEFCEVTDARIDISFSDVTIPQSLLIHFITASDYNETSNIIDRDKAISTPKPIRASTFKKIPLDQNTVSFSTSLPFHLIFAEIQNTYYLAVLQHGYIPSNVISTQIITSQRCPHIRELLDEVTVSYPILRRVKYYHVPCNESSDLVCFHDNDTFMCLCTEQRNANCFHFDFNENYNCPDFNDCENGAKCYQDHPTCPRKTMCVCEECFYGGKCQFNTKTLGLSLDAILGYHIHPRIGISRQSALVKVSIAVTTLMLVVGLISGILSILTFQTKSIREVGCGLYLLASSITSILITVVLNLKVWLLIFSQMSVITSRSLLLFNCISIDFILRSLLAITDWFNACVAFERVLTVFLGIRFNPKKSKRAARLIIFIVPLFTIVSVLHDPVHRRLIDDEEEKRIWCVVRFTPIIEVFNTCMNIFHFIIPFLINIISALSIIIIAAKKRSSARKQQTFKEHLKEQFHHHKHLILSSIILVILALPRLIISFVSGCMKSARDPKSFLAGYFISFIPPLLIFYVFVLPSEVYIKEFRASTRRGWQALRHYLNFQ